MSAGGSHAKGFAHFSRARIVAIAYVQVEMSLRIAALHKPDESLNDAGFLNWEVNVFVNMIICNDN
jgi:hypothetical protein